MSAILTPFIGLDNNDNIRSIEVWENAILDLKGFIEERPKVIKSQMKNSSIDESMLTENEAIILSMTKNEKENPKIISGSRRKRIAIGSGVDVAKINKLLKQFKMMSEMMKKMSKGKKIPSGVLPDEIAAGLRHAAANFSAFAYFRTEKKELDPNKIVDEFISLFTHYLDKHNEPNIQSQTARVAPKFLS